MKLVDRIRRMQEVSRAWQRQGLRVALVPTMGYLHEGHASLIDLAAASADRVVVSIFVNPTQFGEGEDLESYPRDLERDCQICAEQGCHVVFNPDAAEMYQPDSSTWVNEECLGLPLCGKSRPEHFRGVATVCAKLFLAVLPDIAVFGQKDAQQALVLKRMVRDLNFPLEIVVAPIVREPDGLAMSSRNAYLSAAERQAALGISRGLTKAETAFQGGERRSAALVEIVSREIRDSGGRIDYVECVGTDDLLPRPSIDGETLLAAAAHYGPARLLDNLVLAADT